MKFYTVESKKKSIFKIFAIYFSCMALFCIIRIIASLGIIPSNTLNNSLLTVIIQVGCLGVLPFALYCICFKAKPKFLIEECNFFKINIATIFISIALGLMCFVINIAVSSLFNGFLTFTGYRFRSSGGGSDYSTINFFLDVFLVAVLPAIFEEFVHRGLVLQGIKHAGFKKAIVLSSLLFALIHFNIQQVFYAFVIGLILGFVSVVAKNIWPAIIIHFVNNFISTYIDYAQARNWIFGDSLNKLQMALVNGQTLTIFIVSAIIMIIIVCLLCLFIWLLYKQTIIKKVNKVINKVYDSKTGHVSNESVQIDRNQVIKDLLENNTLLNLEYQPMDNPIDIVLPKEKSRYKMNARDMIFMFGAIVLGGLITLFTYIWGLF